MLWKGKHPVVGIHSVTTDVKKTWVSVTTEVEKTWVSVTTDVVLPLISGQPYPSMLLVFELFL